MKPLLGGSILASLAAVSFGTVILMDSFTGSESQTKIANDIAALETQNGGHLSEARTLPVTENVTASASQSVEDKIASALPFGANIGGNFDLIDHHGEARQMEDYAGKHVLIFFGYANCEAICSTALPLMADAVTALGDAAGSELVPLMITVDPENDTPEYMKDRLGQYHPSLIGMTGSNAALADIRRKFKVKIEHVGEDIEGKPIYNHGSFIYLMGPNGEFKTLMPPILEPPQIAKIIKKYIDGEKSAS